MNNFKKFSFEDINTFINLDEFANEHDIDGKPTKCIIDEDINKERNINSQTRHFEGVYSNQCSVFIKSKDIEKPSIAQTMHIDGFMYLVSNVSESDGLYEIELTRNDY